VLVHERLLLLCARTGLRVAEARRTPLCELLIDYGEIARQRQLDAATLTLWAVLGPRLAVKDLPRTPEEIAGLPKRRARGEQAAASGPVGGERLERMQQAAARMKRRK
jgi:hypothetical protein